MTKRGKPSTIDRRSFIKYTGAGSLTVGLAGCTGGDSGGSPTPGDDESDTDSGGASTETQPDEIVIGSNHPLTGFLADTGTRMSNAVKLAAKLKNEAGGIESLGGATVTVVEGDNEGKQELGGQVQQQLIDKGAIAVSGAYSSPVTRAAIQVSERQKIPHVVSISAADNVVQDSMNFAYRTHAPSRGTAKYYADWVPKLIRDAGESAETVGLIHVDNSFGQAIAKHLQSFMPQRNIEVVETVAYPLGASSLNTQVTKLKEADPDMICATTYANGGLQLVDTMKNQDYRPKFMTQCLSAAFSDQAVVDKMGSWSDGVFGTNSSLDRTNPRAMEVISRFRNDYDAKMDALVGMAFTSGEVIIEAIEQAGSTDPEEINKALKEIHIEDLVVALEAMNFDPKTGENRYAISPVQQIQDGTIHVVYPEEFATKQPNI